jgi:hypothetical protein
MATTIQTIEVPKKARALDTSGNNNHGQIYSGRGLEFDGIGDHLSIPLSLMDGATAISISLWFNTTESNSGMIAKYASSSIYAWWINVEGGKLTANINANKSNTSDLTTTIDVNNGNWYHATLTWSYSSGLASLYINGVLVDTDANTNETDLRNGSLNNTIGFQGYISSGVNTEQGGGYHQGLLSNVQIWDAVLTASDVAFAYANPEELALNNSGTLLTESNLKLWYPMQDGHRGQQSYILDGANTGAVVEVVTDGGFANGETDWTFSSQCEVVNDQARILSTDGSFQYISQNNVFDTSKNYKLEFDVISSNGATLGFAGGISDVQTTTLGRKTIYTSPSTTYLQIKRSSGVTDVVIDNVSVKAINDKNHATTVFYGDELVIGNDATHAAVGNWTGQNAATVTGGYDSGDTDHATTLRIQAGDTASERAELAQGSLGTPTVAGRTYLCTFDFKWIDNTDITANTPVNIGGSQLSGAYGIDFDASGWTAYSQPFIAADSTTPCRIYVNDSGHADNEILIDNFSLKEVGAASGWTDADQQLHIPQTALQSYNELAWFDGTSASNAFVALDTQIATTNNNWSLSFWVFQEDNGQSYSFPFGGTSIKNIALKNNNTSKLYYKSNAGSTYHALSNDTIPYGEWVSIVITATADTSITAYINGVAQTTNSDMSDTEIVVDQFMNGYSNTLYNILGTINEISYYSDVLTSAEVLDLFNDGKAKSALEASGSAGLVGYWRNNGLSEWKDLKGSNDGNTTAGVTETILIPQGVDSTRDAQGFIMNKQKDTSSLNLPYGTESGLSPGYVEVNNSDTLKITGAYTLAAWVKLTLIGDTYQRIVALETGANGTNGYGMYVHTDGKVYNASNNNSAVSSSAEVIADTWTYIVVTADGTDKKIYVNGEETDTSSNTYAGAATTSSLFIGKSGGLADRQANGVIDGVLVYDSALDETEILRNYNATKGSHRN